MPEVWTLARIRAANEAAGHDYFGRLEERRCPFLAGHKVHHINGEIWLEQLLPGKKENKGWRNRDVGTYRRFDPATGFISSTIRFEGDQLDRRPGVAA
jgi:hypothetical protein